MKLILATKHSSESSATVKMCNLLYCFVIVVFCVSAPVTGKCPIEDLSAAKLQNNANSTSTNRTLNLQSCQIKTVHKDTFKQFYNLTYLKMYDNSIEHLHEGTFDNNLNLIYMNFGANKLRELDSGVFANLVRVIQLYLYNNELESIEANLFEDMESLYWLDLSGNHIKMLSVDTFRNNVRLYNLYLNRNKLENLPTKIFKPLHKLYSLSIPHNHLSSIHKELFNNLTNLEILHLYNNDIEHISAGTFKYNKRLKVLTLEHNAISSIAADSFPNFGELHEAHLHENKLRNLHCSVTETLEKVTKLTLYSNPWLCDCKLKLLRNIWEPESDDLNIPQCAGPDKFKNLTWASITPADLCLNTIKATIGENISLGCDLCDDNVQWFHGNNFIGEESKSASGYQYSINTATTTVTVSDVRIEDSGWYTCQTTNKSEEMKFLLTPSMPESLNGWQIFGYASPALLIILLIVFVVILVKCYKSRAETGPFAGVRMAPIKSDDVPLGTMPRYTEEPSSQLYEEIKERIGDTNEDGYLEPRILHSL